MFSFFDKIRNYILLALLATLAVGGFYLLSVKSDLQIANLEIQAAKDRIDTLQESERVLKQDLTTKEGINLALSLQMAIINNDNKTDIEDLNEQILTLSKKRKDSIVKIDTSSYIKETYVEEATAAVLDSMWKRYCKLKGDCT
jgi:hypothetical protein